MATVLVSGGTGFIGSALVRRLSAPHPQTEERPEVIVVARELGARTAPLERLPGVRCVTWQQLSPTWSCDVIYNLASFGVRPQDRALEEIWQGNVGLVCKLLDLAPGWGTRRFVHTGSCAEYASIAAPDLLLETWPLEPATLYGAAKAASSIFGATLAKQLGIAWVNLRLFGTYGPGEAEHRIIPSLVKRWCQGQDAAMSLGLQVRDMTFVEDVVDALLLAGDPDVRLDHAVYNVSSQQPVTIADFARCVAQHARVEESRLGLGELPLREGEQMWLVGDSSRFRADTGWAPKVGMDSGVARSVEYFRREFAGGETR